MSLSVSYTCHCVESSDTYPVTLSQVKAHLRLDFDVEDDLIQGYIASATDVIETYLGLSLLQKTWVCTLYPKHHHQGRLKVLLPSGPFLDLISVTELHPLQGRQPYVSYSIDRSGARATFDCLWIYPVEIVYQTGFGSLLKQVPPALRHAVLGLAAWFYDNRSGAPEGKEAIPNSIRSLLKPYRDVSIH